MESFPSLQEGSVIVISDGEESDEGELVLVDAVGEDVPMEVSTELADERGGVDGATRGTDAEMPAASVVEGQDGGKRAGEEGRRRRDIQRCPVETCPYRGTKVKAHVYGRHLPLCFNPNQIGSEEAHKGKMRSLQLIAGWVVRRGASIQDLVEWVNRTHRVPESAVVQFSDRAIFRRTSRREGWDLPEEFTLIPMNSPACLLHFKVLCGLLKELRPEQRRRLFREELRGFELDHPAGKPMAPVQSRSPLVKATSKSKTKVAKRSLELAEAFDSHFHFEETARALGADKDIGVLGILQLVQSPRPKNEVTVVGGTMIYCYPSNFPSTFATIPGFVYAVGIHPRCASLFTREVEEQLRTLLSSPEVRALGEVGLDRTEAPRNWEEQDEVLQKVLTLCSPDKVLILHFRGTSDLYSADVYARGLEIVSQLCSPTQKIHLHCFTGGEDQIRSWMRAFPKVHFGFTAKVRDASSRQRRAIRNIPTDRLLIETDAPHLRTHSHLRAHSPAYIGDVAEMLASVRGEPLHRILRWTTRNARRLYLE
jgi:TatD DNase family protein